MVARPAAAFSWHRVGVVREEAREEVERSRGRFVNFLEIAAPRIAGCGFSKQDLGEPEDDTQLILEVVTVPVVVCHRRQLQSVVRPKSSNATASRSPSRVNGLSR